jgi:hypothetical protein
MSGRPDTADYWWRRAAEAWELSQRYQDEARTFARFARDIEQEAGQDGPPPPREGP